MTEKQFEWWEKKYAYHANFYCSSRGAYIQVNFKTMRAFWLCKGRSSMTSVNLVYNPDSRKLAMLGGGVETIHSAAVSKEYEQWLAQQVLT